MNKNELRILYMGTPDISAVVLSALIENGYNVVGLIAQPDRPVGRKKILEPVPTKKVALANNVPVFQPEKIRKDYEFVKDLKPDIIITLAYGQIVPTGLLEIPPLGALNLHGSLLPKYRGAAPIQYALINNDKITGMTLMEMIDKMDAGRIYAKKELKILLEDNSTSLFIKMGELAKSLILEALPLYVDNHLIGVEQDESLVSFCPTIKPEQEKLDLSTSIDNVLGFIRALSDEPGAYLLLDDEKIKIFKAYKVSNKVKGQTGEILEANKNGLFVQASDGVFGILELQKQGKNRTDYKSFINGNQNLLGKVFH